MKYPIAFFISFMFLPLSYAKTVKYELVVKNEKVNMSGKKEVDFALTVNGGIPAPTLEFTEGDDAEILVKNEISNEEVSIHWHGILLPPEEDGVAYVNTPPIYPGKSRLFKFKIRQNGTFWYHSHTTVQEQKGVYGAFIIHPKKKPFAYDKDVVVVLSDWSDENADQIIRNLRKDGDFYLYKKDSMRSYLGAIQSGGLKTHLYNEWTRMGGMDLSDVGYDAFLINGKRDSQLLTAHPGERIRIRVINAGASSYFYVSMGNEPMQVISADGIDIKPRMAKEILIGMAETYDILFSPKEHKNYELRATVQDVTGFASGWIGMGEKVRAPDKPLPDMYASMDHSNMAGMDHGSMAGMDHGKMAGMDHSSPSMDHSKMEGMKHSEHAEHEKPVAKQTPTREGHDHAGTHHGGTSPKSDGQSAHAGHGAPALNDPHAGHKMPAKPKNDQPKDEESNSGTVDFSSQSDAAFRQNAARRNFSDESVIETLTVDALEAIESTALPRDAKIHELKLVLGGDMERYIWHINGKAIYEDRLIEISKGEIVRFTFQNDTMMHHPMHLHGHFFRVVNKNGDLSPLKHTVDVPPHGSRTIEFFANEPGQWMLHCHNLYHMKTGMARVVRYKDFKLTPDMEMHDKHDPHLHDHIYTAGALQLGTNHSQAQFRVIKTWDELNLKLEANDSQGKNYSFDHEWETEGDLLYNRWFTNFFNISVGGTYFEKETYGIAGFGYVLPMLVEMNAFVNSKGKIRVDLEKRFQWTKNIFTDAEIKWLPDWHGGKEIEYKLSLMYGPSWYWSAGITGSDKSVGAAAQVRF